MMDNLVLTLSLAIPLLGALSTAVGLAVKVAIAVKQRNKEMTLSALEEAAREAVAFAESLKSRKGDDLLGETKKSIALVRVNQSLLEKGYAFDAEMAGEVIERIIQLTKAVNVTAKQLNSR